MEYRCPKHLNFQECELAILRHNVDNIESVYGRRQINSPEIKKILKIVGQFIRSKQLIIYGGQAINAYLPKDDKFYDENTTFPDWDCYDSEPIESAKKLVDLFASKGFYETEAKSGLHVGTYKVFVNFIPVLDLTYLPFELFQAIKRESVKMNGFLYAPVNLLRMSMYLELSRPMGDISRWEKVLKRLGLLNKAQPFKYRCPTKQEKVHDHENNKREKRYRIILETFIQDDAVFFGGYAMSQYSKYLHRPFYATPEFDVLSTHPQKLANLVVKNLKGHGFSQTKAVQHAGVGEIIPPHYEILVGEEPVAFIYKPISCHSYNLYRGVKIATIDTILSFYLAFIYSERPYHDVDRLLCMANFLFKIQQHHRLSQRGLLKRFTLNCIGQHHGLLEMRAMKADKYRKLHKTVRNTDDNNEYIKWFFRYMPSKTRKKLRSRSKKI